MLRDRGFPRHRIPTEPQRNPVKDILKELDDWTASGQEIALATVVDVAGSAPRPSGARLGLTRKGAMIGSVSGGCVESDVYERALRVLDEGEPALVTYGPAPPDGFEVGLSCDGKIEVLIEAFVADEVWNRVRQAVEDDCPAAIAIGLAPARVVGVRLGIVGETREGLERVGSIDPAIDERVADEALRLLRGRGKGVFEFPAGDETHRIFIESFAPAQRLYLVGATHIAVSLCRMAKEVGFQVILIDPRTAFARGDRFRDADEVSHEWPVDVLDGALLNADAYVLTLTHDVKFDLPTLARALESDVRYIGALGSRRTHAKRLEALRAQGFGDEVLARIKTPVGLDLGGRRPEEIALAILAEMVATRYERSGGSLSAR
jgi:xanthine dehydrogenase accessory factor